MISTSFCFGHRRLVDDIPKVSDVLSAVLKNFKVGRVFVANEFIESNGDEAISTLSRMFPDSVVQEKLPHDELKKLVPVSVGIIRTGDTTQYANLILESA